MIELEMRNDTDTMRRWRVMGGGNRNRGCRVDGGKRRGRGVFFLKSSVEVRRARAVSCLRPSDFHLHPSTPSYRTRIRKLCDATIMHYHLVKVAVGQITSTPSIAHNLAQCRKVVEQAVAGGAKVEPSPGFLVHICDGTLNAHP
jgi:hypothetical protein